MNSCQLFLSFLFGLGLSGTLRGQVPGIIHFQGVVSDGEEKHHGLASFKFSLLNSNGTLTFWSNDGSGRNGEEPAAAVEILVHKGAFAVNLGDNALRNMLPIPATVFTNVDVRLRVWFSNKKERFEQLKPDQRIAAAGYALVAATVPDGTLTADKLAPGFDVSAIIRDGSITTAKVAAEAITTSKIAPGAVGPRQLADRSITKGKLASEAVEGSNIASNAIGSSQLAAGAVTLEKLAPGLSIPALVPDGSIATEKLADAAVTTRKIAPGAIGSNQLASGTALANLLASGQGTVPSDGIILSPLADAANLAKLNYVNLGKVDLTAREWRVVTADSAPANRAGHTAVWTGREMIVWGGYDGSTPGPFATLLYSGGRFDTALNLWHPTATFGAPFPRSGHSAIWSGTEMIIWGGSTHGVSGYFDTGGRYDPSRDSWVSTPTTGAPSPRSGHTAIWTDGEMIIWGGNANIPTFLNTGARYNPSSNAWTPISTNGAPAPRRGHVGVWTGSEMIVWGGDDSSGFLNTGGRYNPREDSWSPTSVASAPSPRDPYTAVWTGSDMIIWGGDEGQFSNTGGRYNPASDQWLPTRADASAPAPRRSHTAVWTGTEMVVWGGQTTTQGGLTYPANSGGRYNPVNDTWTPTTSLDAPVGREWHTAVWSGTEMLIFGGHDNNNNYVNYLHAYDPATVRTLYLYLKR